MASRWHALVFVLVVAALVGWGAGSSALQEATTASQKAPTPSGSEDGIPPKFLHGHDLKVRPGGEKDFNEKTPRIGVELYHDVARNVVLAISEKGWIAAVPAPVLGKSKPGCMWLTAHDLHARKADEKDFTPKTRKYGVEVFHDPVLRHLLYICESGSVALAPLPAGLVTDRGPKLLHAFTLAVRRPEQNDFTNAPRFGVEVFRDLNTPDGLICIVGETGSIATVPSPNTPATSSPQVKDPQTLYGLILRVRTATEKTFGETTRRYSVEVYADPNTATGHLLYVSQTGAIAAVPQKKWDDSKRGVTWLGGMAVRARPAGERSFDKARQYNIEVFRDNRTGHLLYICETGSIAVVSP
jgi:hypothetical protein